MSSGAARMLLTARGVPGEGAGNDTEFWRDAEFPSFFVSMLGLGDKRDQLPQVSSGLGLLAGHQLRGRARPREAVVGWAQ